jgi:hypothetical protein
MVYVYVIDLYSFQTLISPTAKAEEKLQHHTGYLHHIGYSKWQ